MTANHLLKWPLWVGELFTTAKSFETNPILGSHVLNRAGLHVARVAAAHALTAWRRLLLSALLPAELRRSFRRDGFVQIENFLPTEDFRQLKQEVQSFKGDLRRMVQGDTHTLQGLLDRTTIADMPATQKLLCDKTFLRLMMYGGAAFKHPIFFVHQVKNGVTSGDHDPQKDLHSDTFHPTMKAWLFLDDVDDQNGPFVFVPGSHRLSRRRLKWEYEKSVEGSRQTNKYARRGSFRIDEHELRARGFAHPMAFRVPANTLIMADTTGFHRRGDAQPGSHRTAIYAYSRTNPFNPLPGAFPGLWRRVEEYVTRRSLQKGDEMAAQRGGRATWHAVPNSEIARHGS